jgi:hypothetical protein
VLKIEYKHLIFLPGLGDNNVVHFVEELVIILECAMILDYYILKYGAPLSYKIWQKLKIYIYG